MLRVDKWQMSEYTASINNYVASFLSSDFKIRAFAVDSSSYLLGYTWQ